MASITFIAHLLRGKEEVTLTEKGYFQRYHGKWLYRSGQLTQGQLTPEPLKQLPLAYYGEGILHQKSLPIDAITEEVKQLTKEMIETMDASGGIGLAAPQVHHLIQLFIIRTPLKSSGDHLELGEVEVFINPKISTPSKETWKASEGCLSIPTIYSDVIRPWEIKIEYTNLAGERIQKRAKGWEARIILHENDHLSGVLFIDRLKPKERRRLEPSLQRLKKRLRNDSFL